MHPVHRNFDIPTANKAPDSYLYTLNHKPYFDTNTRPLPEPLMLITKPNKNGIGLVQQIVPRIPSNGASTDIQNTKPPGPIADPKNTNTPLEIADILPALKQLELRVVSLSEAVLHHQQILTSGQNSKASETNQSVNNISKLVHQELEKHRELMFTQDRESTNANESKLFLEISNLKQELLKQLNEKSLQDRKYLSDTLKRQTETQILNMYEGYRDVFRRIEIDMNELRQLIENQKQSLSKHLQQHEPPSFFSSNRKFQDPKVIRYRQVIESMQVTIGQSPSPKPGSEPAVINEVIYYLDKDGYLLDSMCNYLIDNTGQGIRLEEKKVSVLKRHNILV